MYLIICIFQYISLWSKIILHVLSRKFHFRIFKIFFKFLKLIDINTNSPPKWTLQYRFSALLFDEDWKKYALSWNNLHKHMWLHSSVRFSHSVMLDTASPQIAACQASLSITNSRSSLKLMLIELVMPFSHLILCRPLLLLPPIGPSIRVFSNESTLRIRWPKYWSSSFSISPSNEHPGLISFRMDWLDLLAVQRTFKSLL